MGSHGVGMPTALYLEQFGQLIEMAFGHTPYLVGSCLKTTAWRDVDVRLILDDEEYAAMGLGEPEREHQNAKWVALTMAFAALGKQMTGLPIDFQIQQRTYANTKFEGGGRSALGIELWIMMQNRYAPQTTREHHEEERKDG